MACTASIEFCVALWASNLLRDQGGLGNAAAAASLGCIYGGVFVSRVVVARIAVRMDTQPIYAASLAVSLLAFAIFWSSHSSVVMVIALLATGLAIAPHFPLGMTRSMVASNRSEEHTSELQSH